MRLKQRTLRISYNMSKDPENYDTDAVDNRMDQHVIAAAPLQPANAGWCCGVFHNGRLVLTPVTVCQMRPTFKHLDVNKEARQLHPTEPVVQEDTPAQSSVVGVKFLPKDRTHRKETARQIEQKKAEQEESEEWIRMAHYDLDSVESSDVYFEHFLKSDLGEKVEYKANPEMYLNSICGAQAEEPVKDLDPLPISQFALSRMSIEQQVEMLIRHLVVASLSHVKRRLPPASRKNTTDKDLLAHLENFAVLVQGNWVLKSGIAGYDGSELYVRDLLLCVLDTKNSLPFEQVHSATHLPEAALKDMLKQIAVEQDKFWQLKCTPDQEFIKEHPEIVQKYKTMWQTQKPHVVAQIKAYQSNEAPSSGTNLDSQMRTRISTELKRLMASGAKSMDELKRDIQQNSTQKTIHEEILRAVMPTVGALEVRGMWMLEKTGDPHYDEYRRVLMSLFRHQTVYTKTQIVAEFERELKKKCSLTDFALRKLLREFSELRGGYWIFRGSEDCKTEMKEELTDRL